MLGIVSFSIQMAIRRSRKLNNPAQEQAQREKAADTQREKNALAEALRRNPELSDKTNPENVRQLKAAADEIIEDTKTTNLLAQIEREKKAEEYVLWMKEKHKVNQQKVKEQAQQVVEDKRLAREVFIEKTANYSFIKRTYVRHKIETAIGAGLVLAIILTLTLTVGIPEIQRQQERAAAEQAELALAASAEATRSMLIEACNAHPDMGDLNTLDQATLEGFCGTAARRMSALQEDPSDINLTIFASDPAPEIRRLVAANTQTTPDTLSLLAVDTDPEVRRFVAANTQTTPDTLNLLAVDTDPEVRRFVAGNTATKVRTLKILAADQVAAVRITVAGQKKVTPQILAQLANDQKFTIRLKVAQNMGTSLMTLRALAKDENKTVAGVAQESLNKR